MSVFVYLSKFLPTLVYPAGLIFFTLIAALAASKKRKLQKGLILFALIILFISGNQYPSAFVIRSLESRYPPYSGTDRAPIIVVMGGGTDSNEYPRQMVELSGAADRIYYGAKLWKEGRGDYLLFGGAYYELLSGEKGSIAADMKTIALSLGVPEEKILLQEKSLNSYEEAIEDALILKEKGVDEIILVTSATHMARAVGVFEKQNIRVIPAPTDYSYSDQDWKNLLKLDWKRFYTYIIPEASNMRSLETGLKEYIGILVYRLRGWMD